MNNITLKSCVFNNFMSYGNNVNEFTFPNGLVWMTADNGSGKSTLVEAINFAMFGTSYRGGNKSELRNSRNVDGTLRVMLEFDCEKVAGVIESYRVTRSISPKGTNKFEVEKLEGETWVSQSKRAGYGQKDFETSILGFSEVLFKNTIAMNTQESIPFLEMTAKERRAMLEAIIMVSWDAWKKETSTRLSAACTAFNIAESDIGRITSEIDSLSAIRERLREEKKANIELLEQQLADFQGKLAPAAAKLNELVALASAKKQEIDGYSSAVAGESYIDQAIARINAAGTEISVLKRNRDELSMKEAELQSVMERYRAMPANVLRNQLDSVNATLHRLAEQRRGVDGDIATANAKAAGLESQMNEITAQAKAMKPGVPCPTCGKPSTEEDIEKHKVEFRRRWMELRDRANVQKGIAADQGKLLGELIASIGTEEQNKADIEKELSGITDFYNKEVAPAESAVNSLRAAVARSESVVAAAGIDPAQFSAEIDRLTAEKQKFPEIRAKWQAAYNEWNALTQSIASAQSEYDGINANVTRLTNEIAVAKQRAADDSLAMTEKQLSDAQAELADAQSRLHEESDNRLAYEYIGQNMCADDGIKKMIFSKFVPAFNKSLERNIRRLNLPCTLEFDDSMTAIYHAPAGFAPSYDMLSQGQKRKLGFAISMTFRDFATMVGNFKINFLSMDEVLDISTDDSGMREMLEIVRDMAEEIGCALVITHRGAVVADKFDYRITVEYDGNYSNLGELEKL